MQENSSQNEVPSGFALRCTLRYTKPTNQIAWSPYGSLLASLCDDGTIQIWNVKKREIVHSLVVDSDLVNYVVWSPDGAILAFCVDNEAIQLWDLQTKHYLPALGGRSRGMTCMAWSPDRETLAIGSFDRTIQLWNVKTGQFLHLLTGHSDVVNRVEWSPDGMVLASCSDDKTVRLWGSRTGKNLRTLMGHSGAVRNIVWSLKGTALISSDDKTICLWDSGTGRETRVLEGHVKEISSISLSCFDRLLASKSYDGTICVWRTDTWQVVAILKEELSYHYLPPSLAFHPKAPVLTTTAGQDMAVHIWDIDVAKLFTSPPTVASVHYTNARVVLVGDSGVGKSGLGLVLSGKSFIPTESTHGRHIWTFDTQEVKIDETSIETRETLLWDLAGQPGYRLIHQLHLNEVAVVLVVFDSHNETDPFAGVLHWARALRTAERVHWGTTLTMKKILVAARIDRGGKRVSRERIDALLQQLGFDCYIETSAKEGLNISDLKRKIKDAINWEELPKVTSTNLFRSIKAFLVMQKKEMRFLSTIEDLYQIFLVSKSTINETSDLKSLFLICINLVESQGLIKKLGFGDLVLLQPELLDTYASALINAVRDEPDGQGSILEEKVRSGQFFIPEDERILDAEQEKLLLIAMIEDLLRYEIALREESSDGLYLVFPSQSTRENVDLPSPEGKSVIFDFEGPVRNVYATLAVRLSHSGFFKKKALWRNAVTYTSELGGTFGILLQDIDEGRAELILFFDQFAREVERFHFEEYIKAHLERKAVPETIMRWRVFVCPGCNTSVEKLYVALRKERGFSWMNCCVCDTAVSLLDHKERLMITPDSIVAEMDFIADTQVERETAKSRLQGKIETNDFDVFLCYNDSDKEQIRAIGQQLKDQGILPWLDEWELRPGFPWQRLLEEQIEKIKSVAVFVGGDGVGPWQQEELSAFLSEFARRECPIIPVFLQNAPDDLKLPPFLDTRVRVDFRRRDPDPMVRLVWGITGERRVDL